MAFGTPVAGAAAFSAAGGTTVTPAYPAGILATDAVLLFVGQKPSTANGGTVTTPAGFTLREELLAAGGYGTTLGADTGNTNLRVYSQNTPVTGQTGTQSVTLGVNNVSWAFIVRVPTGGGTLSYGSADGQRTTTPTSPMSIALTNGTSPTAFQAGDIAIYAMCIPTDVTTPSQFSNQSITATGAIFATAVEMNEPDSAIGNDIGGYSAYALVSSGTSSTAPTVTVTLAGTLTNVRGPVALVRIRELAALELNAEPASYVVTGSSADLLKDSSLNAEPASYAVTGVDATLAKELMVNAEPGAYAITGFDAALLEDRNLVAESGTYAVTGLAVTFEIVGAGQELIAESGAYDITGFVASLARSIPFNAETGAYVVTGSSAEFNKAIALNADSATYDITGFSADLKKQSALSADAGAYAITGLDATLNRDLLLNAALAEFNINGLPVTFGYPRYPLPDQVLAGVLYGPNGDNFVGTFVCPPGSSKQILYIFDD